MKKLDNRGFAHHLLLLIILITVSVACFGTYVLIKSNADSVQSVAVTSADGCWLAGRTYTKSCQAACRYPKLANNKLAYTDKAASGVKRGYCTQHANVNIDKATCVAKLHRQYIAEVGCARRVDQDNKNSARQCQPDYPNYIAETQTDRCTADKIVVQPKSETSFTDTPTSHTNNDSSSTSAANNPNSTLNQITCDLVGRVYTAGRGQQVGVCTDSCQPNGGTLLIGKTTIAQTSVKREYCLNSVTSNDGNEQTCVTKLHRVWTLEGCARRIDQVDNAGDTVRCQPGYPYYNADFKPADAKASFVDVCEQSKQTAAYNEAHNTIGAAVTTIPKNNNSTSISTSINSTLTLDSTINRQTCELLGRVWQITRNTNSGNQTRTGCSTIKCLTKDATIVALTDGKIGCQGYTDAISLTQCTFLHRQWISGFKRCALNSQQHDNKTVPKAVQCVSPYTTYIFHTASEGHDECLKPSRVQQIKSIAAQTKKPFTYVASLPNRGLCNIQPGKHWKDGKCVKDPTENFRIATFNTRFDVSSSATVNDIRKLNEADIIGLQEMPNDDHVAAVKQNFVSCDGCQYASFAPRSPEGANDYVIMWKHNKFTKIDSGSIYVAYAPWVKSQMRIAWVKLQSKETGRSLYLLDNHLPAHVEVSGKYRSGSDRIDEYGLYMTKITDFMKQRGNDSTPVFAVGDFNVDFRYDAEVKEPNFPTARVKSIATSNFQELGATKLGTHVSVSANGCTSNKNSQGARIIDYVFASKTKQLSFKQQQVIPSSCSDHNAVSVLMEWK